jgi:hypothetical protein
MGDDFSVQSWNYFTGWGNIHQNRIALSQPAGCFSIG